MAREIDETVTIEPNSFGFEQSALQPRMLLVRRDPAAPVDDALPGNRLFTRGTNRPAHPHRREAAPNQRRDLSVCRNLAARNAAHDRPYPLERRRFRSARCGARTS